MNAHARTVSVLSHGRAHETADALRALRAAARAQGVTLRLDTSEAEKHGLAEEEEGLVLGAPPTDDVELCVVLGGDGTILRALRRYAGTSVPVYAVNFGEIGFLATIDPGHDDLEEGFARALAGDFEILTLPALAVETPDGPHAAINDLSIHRKPGQRVASLSYSVGSEEVGSVRADGLVIATPAGSTGYNLANGGPVMAWGVEGFVVSFIAPHSLTARALVVAPDDLLTIHNRSHGAVEVALDGIVTGTLGPGEALTAGFLREAADLAQVPGSSFYRRLREKFGRLSN